MTSSSNTSPAFPGVVATEAELRGLIGTPSDRARRKQLSALDAHCRALIERSPFVVLSTAGANGQCDASPRGDHPGFVAVLDDHRLLIPERPGNRRVDSLLNILQNPHVGLLFVVPGLNETLRVNGRASVIRDAALLAPLAVQGRAPTLGVGVEVLEAYLHCGKAFLRSGLWDPARRADLSGVASAGQILADHAAIPGMTGEDCERDLSEAYRERLY